MVEAYVLVTVGIGKVRETFEKISEIEGVKNAHIVTGSFDVIALAESDNMSNLTNVVIEKIGNVEGVEDTSTSVVTE